MKNSNLFFGLTSVSDILTVSGLDFKASKTPLYSKELLHSDLQGITTNDNRFLGIAGKNYTCVQNNEFFDFLNPLLNSKDIIIENAYQYKSKSILKLRTKEKTAINVNDLVQHYIYASNDFSGKNSSEGMFYSIRLACTNGMKKSNKECSFSIKHFNTYQEKLRQAIELMSNFQLYAETLKNDISKMQETKFNNDDFLAMVNSFLGIDSEKEKQDLVSSNILNKRKAIVELYNTKEDLKAYNNTLFKGYSAITDYYSNNATIRNSSDNLIKENALVFENSANQLQKAYSFAMELTSN